MFKGDTKFIHNYLASFVGPSSLEQSSQNSFIHLTIVTYLEHVTDRKSPTRVTLLLVQRISITFSPDQSSNHNVFEFQFSSEMTGGDFVSIRYTATCTNWQQSLLLINMTAAAPSVSPLSAAESICSSIQLRSATHQSARSSCWNRLT